MGGRGSRSYSTHHRLVSHDALTYSAISFDSPRGTASYPFLDRTQFNGRQRAWHLLTRPVGTPSDYHHAHTFSQTQPTLRWVNGDHVCDLFVDGADTATFLQASGLQFDMHKGSFVLSKRLSRILRPYRISRFFSAETHPPTIAYMQQTSDEAKVWDGASLVSRRFLQRMGNSAELAHAQRVEFTIMTAKGQDKGHAIVADDLRDELGQPLDFLLPEDTKREVRLNDGTFVGLNIVHGSDSMRLDIQSLINLHPFFDTAQLLACLQAEGELFIESIKTGEIAAVMGRIKATTSGADLARWPLKAYLAAGGHPLWFRTHVKSLIGQHLKRLNHQQLEKMRLPIPGGRHYVMPVGVGRRAGRRLDVRRGEIRIDAECSTAWVNDADWLALQDSAENKGIADILGGADNDDALWLHPFTDYDGERKVLAWRSPNQLGEYVILKPTPDSAELPFTTTGDSISYPQADSRKLPRRIDYANAAYQGLVDPQTAGGLGEGADYSVAVMDTAIARAIANQGALGMYCNSLMLSKALFDKLPDAPPAPLEDVIDSAVKTGADLSAIVQWNYDYTRTILEQRTPIPALLTRRLSIDRSDLDNRPPSPRLTDDHWLSHLEGGIRNHIGWVQQQRDELMALARPPQALFDAVEFDVEALQLGRGLNQTFAAALARKDSAETNPSSRLSRACKAVENYLSYWPPATQQRILLGALASAYEGESNVSDVAAWLAGSAESDWFPNFSIAQQTIAALKSITLLDP